MRKFSQNFYFIEPSIYNAEVNMNIDNYLFESLMNEKIAYPILRTYCWSEPCVSLGYNQDTTLGLPDSAHHVPFSPLVHNASLRVNGSPLRKSYDENLNLPKVKRITGGQAVFHETYENELTYSVVLCSTLGPKDIYNEISKPLISLLEKYKLKASIGYLNDNYTSSFNCFETKTSADIVVDDIKIIGSAQRVKRKTSEGNKKQYILQHGSIKLDKIRELSGSCVDYKSVSCDLRFAFEKVLGVNFTDLKIEEVYEHQFN